MINFIGRFIPKGFKRRIADLPGMLNLFEKLSKSELQEVPTPEGGTLIINPLFHSNLMHAGDLEGYEPDIREAIKQLAKPGMVAYDIGANIGIFSFLFASIVGADGFVYSFEPEENNYFCFEKSQILNKYNNIILDKRPVGTRKSKEIFDRRGGAFSGRLIGGGLYDQTDNIKMVEVVSIDYLVKEESYRAPDIIKIDVEGNEIMVLEGMRYILENFNPIIICELHSHLGESPTSAKEILSSYGYSISDINVATVGRSIPPKGSSKKALEKHILAIKNLL